MRGFENTITLITQAYSFSVERHSILIKIKVLSISYIDETVNLITDFLTCSRSDTHKTITTDYKRDLPYTISHWQTLGGPNQVAQNIQQVTQSLDTQPRSPPIPKGNPLSLRSAFMQASSALHSAEPWTEVQWAKLEEQKRTGKVKQIGNSAPVPLSEIVVVVVVD